MRYRPVTTVREGVSPEEVAMAAVAAVAAEMVVHKEGGSPEAVATVAVEALVEAETVVAPAVAVVQCAHEASPRQDG